MKKLIVYSIICLPIGLLFSHWAYKNDNLKGFWIGVGAILLIFTLQSFADKLLALK